MSPQTHISPLFHIWLCSRLRTSSSLACFPPKAAAFQHQFKGDPPPPPPPQPKQLLKLMRASGELCLVSLLQALGFQLKKRIMGLGYPSHLGSGKPHPE